MMTSFVEMELMLVEVIDPAEAGVACSSRGLKRLVVVGVGAGAASAEITEVTRRTRVESCILLDS